jgi:hypothetical protein
MEARGKPPRAVVLIDTFHPNDVDTSPASTLLVRRLASMLSAGDSPRTDHEFLHETSASRWIYQLGRESWEATRSVSAPTLYIHCVGRYASDNSQIFSSPHEFWAPILSNLCVVETTADHFSVVSDEAKSTVKIMLDWLATIP